MHLSLKEDKTVIPTLKCVLIAHPVACKFFRFRSVSPIELDHVKFTQAISGVE